MAIRSRVGLAFVFLLAGVVQVAVAQRPGRSRALEASLDSVSRRVEFISPRSGPPGTVVTLRTGTLPAITPLRIGIGATRFGFEEIGQVMSDQTGHASLTVVVPTWAQYDVTYRFIVFDFYFFPLALSDVFHVTGPNGTILRRGEITDEGVECPTLRDDNNVLYTLAGDIQQFEVGDSVVVEGTIAEMSMCMQATTIEIVRITSP